MKTAEGAKLAAIQQAEIGQEQRCPGWKDIAGDYLEAYARVVAEFSAEDVRAASAGLVPVPKDSRAWGGIFRKAAMDGIIELARIEPTKSISSHKRPANVWKSKIAF